MENNKSCWIRRVLVDFDVSVQIVAAGVTEFLRHELVLQQVALQLFINKAIDVYQDHGRAVLANLATDPWDHVLCFPLLFGGVVALVKNLIPTADILDGSFWESVSPHFIVRIRHTKNALDILNLANQMVIDSPNW